MIKKCMSYCNTDKYIKLRNNIFYFTMELPRQNGKRRFFCKSLHTYNYYEAREKAKIMAENIQNFDTTKFINDFNTLWNQVVFEYSGTGSNLTGFAMRRISPRTDPMVLKQLKILSEKMDLVQQNQLTPGEKVMLGQLSHFLPQIDTILAKMEHMEQILANNQPIQPKPTKNYTVREILESMAKKSNNTDPTKDRKYRALKSTFENINFNLDSDYMDFYNSDVIQRVSDEITNNKTVQGDTKRKYIRYVKEFIEHAHILEPDVYKDNLLQLLPKVSKTPKAKRNPHFPYSQEQLLEIFDPKHDYFKKNPDQFWACMIALFTGARNNAVVTVQFGNIIKQENIDCIQFTQNHFVKHLKNEASERIVPIPAQLLNMGFLDYIQKQKTKLKATDSDFIFPKGVTKSGNFNNKFIQRGFLTFVEQLGFKGPNAKKLDFHSFRKNASEQLQYTGIPQSFINDIIGWAGRNTMEQSYSNHTLTQIKEQADKLNYDFLQPHFDKWMEIMKKLK